MQNVVELLDFRRCCLCKSFSSSRLCPECQAELLLADDAPLEHYDQYADEGSGVAS